MILEILLICIVCIIVAIVSIFLMVKFYRIGIKEGKPNITININQSEKKLKIEEMTEMFKTINLLLAPRNVRQIEKQKKEND